MNKSFLAGVALSVAFAVPAAADIDDGVQWVSKPQYMSGTAMTLEAPDAGQPLLSFNDNPRGILVAQAVEEDSDNDPLEPVNRAIFQFNEVVYGVLLTPLAKGYNKVVPGEVRLALSNFLSHLATPVTLINDLLQLEFRRAMVTTARFVVNTSIGVGGLVDVADGIGLDKHNEDFGQTLGSYGVGEGFYLVLPIIGPSNPRDAVGQFVVDMYFDPLGMYLENTERDRERFGRMGVSAFTTYAEFVDELEQLRRTSVDYYAAVRSLYRQRRAALIANGETSDIPNIPNYDLNFLPEDGNVATSK